MNTTAPAPAPVKARPGVRPGTRPGVRSDIRPARTPAVEVRGLTKTFGPVTAVDRLDLTVASGEVVAFLGPNGAGKSTTLDVLLGFTRPDAGTAAVLGVEPREAVRAGRVGAVLQSGGILPSYTVRQTLDIIASLQLRAPDVEAIIDQTDLRGILRRRVARCSGGEVQRIRLAMALMAQPELLILDEPTTGLDPNARAAFWATMRAQTAAGRSILFATHYLQEAADFADRIVIIDRGRLVASGSVDEVRAMGEGTTVSATWPGLTGQAQLRAALAPVLAAAQAAPATAPVAVAVIARTAGAWTNILAEVRLAALRTATTLQAAADDNNPQAGGGADNSGGGKDDEGSHTDDRTPFFQPDIDALREQADGSGGWDLDANQTLIGDCFLLAALQAYSQTPEGQQHLRDHVRWDEDKQAFVVTLYDHGRPVDVEVRDTYTNGNRGQTSMIDIYERAYGIHFGDNELANGGVPEEDALEVISSGDAHTLSTWGGSGWFRWPRKEDHQYTDAQWDEIQQAVQDGRPVVGLTGRGDFSDGDAVTATTDTNRSGTVGGRPRPDPDQGNRPGGHLPHRRKRLRPRPHDSGVRPPVHDRGRRRRGRHPAQPMGTQRHSQGLLLSPGRPRRPDPHQPRRLREVLLPHHHRRGALNPPARLIATIQDQPPDQERG